MRSLLLFLGSAAMLTGVHANPSSSSSALALDHNIGQPQQTLAVLNSSSPESVPSRSLPISATPAADSSQDTATHFELESSLVLALTAILALIVVARRRRVR